MSNYPQLPFELPKQWVGFLLVLMTNLATVLLSVGALAVIALYPFMKRYTNLPQVVLGIAFSWGILMAFTAQTETVPTAAILLFIANTLWTIAYDTPRGVYLSTFWTRTSAQALIPTCIIY